VADRSSLMLAIDTSTEMAGLAIYDGSRVSELIWHSGRNQSSVLLEQITHLLTINRFDISMVDAIAVALGPGTFNGLRVGLSTAKGLGYGRSIPVFGVDTLEVTAYPHLNSSKPIRAFVPAGRGRVVFGDYQFRNGRWVRSGEFQNRTFDELTVGLPNPTLLAGEAPANISLDGHGSDHADFARASLRTRRPGSLAEIAWKRWEAGEQDDVAALEPLYVHGTRPGS
jgi:tRNA threonylcarbamoyladenosine biosynthesis protein TsaB